MTRRREKAAKTVTPGTACIYIARHGKLFYRRDQSRRSVRPERFVENNLSGGENNTHDLYSVMRRSRNSFVGRSSVRDFALTGKQKKF